MDLHRLLLIAACLIFAARLNSAEEAELPGDRLVREFLRDDTRKIGEGALAEVSTAKDWEAGREKLHRQYLDMLGLWPLPPRTPLAAQTTGTIERDGFRVEKVHFQSRPGLYVTSNFYLPRRVEGKLPAVLYLCGHSGRGRDGNKTAFQHHGMWFATHGYACLIVDTLQYGEVAGIHHGTYRYNRWWWQARGYTSAGVECWNAIRALDYLESRPEVDASRLAATGISGGGAATFWVTAADPRVKAAVPVSGMGDLETYVTDQVINGHCDCMMLINTYRWEWTTIAALVAPRPLLFANSDHDTIFPMSGNERIAARLKRLYGVLGRPEAFSTVVAPGGHDDKLPLRLAAYRWINRWLLKDDREVTEPELPKIEGADLRAFPDRLPADAINDRIDESFVAAAKLEIPREPSQYGPWKDGLLKELQARAFGAPEGEILVPRFRLPTPPVDERRVWLLVPSLGDTETDWSREFANPRNSKVVIFHPRGIGEGAWTVRPPHYVERAMALVGRTADSGRVWDVRRAALKVYEHCGKLNPIGVIGRGQGGVIAAYAALFEPTIDRVVVVDPPRSHREGPTFLNVLRICDIPDALGLLAPRRLNLAGAAEDTNKRVEAIYAAAGAKDRLTVKRGREAESQKSKVESEKPEED
jgi:cephalosporin-C deacetylase-like acetyl esterase